jgi:enoyl-CoA hydratase
VSTPHLLSSYRDSVLTLTVNRPDKRNALSLALLDDLAATLAAHRNEPGLRAVVITAAGDRCFAAGGDLKELEAVRSEAEAAAMSRRGRAALDAVREFPLPVIGAINGLALGGGAELAMACDARVASAHAEIGFLQAQLNVTTAWGGGIDLCLALGGHVALEILTSARRIAAPEAADLGLFNYVCGPEQALAEGLAEYLRPWLERSPGVLRGFKAIARASRLAAHAIAAPVEEAQLSATWAHQDHWDALAAAARRRESQRRGG